MSKPRPLELRGKTALILLSMRPGPMTLDALEERFGSAPTSQLSRLLANGLVERCQVDGLSAYRITPAGRQRCPTRRALYAGADDAIRQQEAKERAWRSGGRPQP